MLSTCLPSEEGRTAARVLRRGAACTSARLDRAAAGEASAGAGGTGRSCALALAV